MKGRGLLVLVILLSAGAMTAGVLNDGRLGFVPGGWVPRLAVIWIPAIIAIVGLLWTRRRIIRWVAVAPFTVFGIRYAIPVLFSEEKPLQEKLVLPYDMAQAQAALRFVAAAQEQYRLLEGKYSGDRAALAALLPGLMPDATLELVASGDRGWVGRAQVGGATCEIHVGARVSPPSDSLFEGIPWCRGVADRAAHQEVHGAEWRGQVGPRGTPLPAGGEWRQHRADPRRSGTLGGDTIEVRWDAWLSGEIRSSASVAGQQVFVGAHGNGEVASFALTDGRPLWRIRAPNWLHHEPVVSSGVVVYGFGNNESFLGTKGDSIFGTPPNGFEAVDQRTGKLLWRQLLSSPAMGAPVIAGDWLIGREYRGTLTAWRLSSGEEVWRSSRVGISPMSNPALDDSVIAVTQELAGWCVHRVRDGQPLRCGEQKAAQWGGGHTSPTLVGSRLLMSFESSSRPFTLRHLVGTKRGLGQDSVGLGAVVLVGIDWRDGVTVWRNRFVGERRRMNGHIAGTSVVVDSVAFVPLPIIDEVVAVRMDDGAVKWRAKVLPARGSVSVVDGRVFIANRKQKAVVLDAQTGRQLCEQPLPGAVDRAPLTIAGRTGILTFLDGRISAAPLSQWFSCSVTFPAMR